jgi:hypothetical protein
VCVLLFSVAGNGRVSGRTEGRLLSTDIRFAKRFPPHHSSQERRLDQTRSLVLQEGIQLGGVERPFGELL